MTSNAQLAHATDSPEPPVNTRYALTPHKHAPVQDEGDVRRGHDHTHELRTAREVRDMSRVKQGECGDEEGGSTMAAADG